MQQEMQLKNKKIFRLPLRVYLSYLLILTLIFTAVSFAKFATSGGMDNDARVASFAVSAGSDDSTELSASFDDAETKFSTSQEMTYTIAVRNYDDSVVSEVALRYDIIVTLDRALPAGITLMVDGRNAANVSGNTYTFSGFSAFAPGAQSTNTHTLKITAASTSITTDINDLGLNISVYFEQID